MPARWLGRSYTRPASDTLVHIPQGSNIHRFGDPNNATAVLRDVAWTVTEGESWAVLGHGAQKTALLRTLHGHLRIAPPPPGGLFPFLSASHRNPHTDVALVSFAHRPRAAGTAFYDYTARYGAVRDDDRVTLRESLGVQSEDGHARLHALADRLGLAPLLDLPLVALSNGQTRRARILRALLSQPALLLLDEPLTGVDADGRSTLLAVLGALHAACAPRLILGLRTQDPVPDWITHVARVSDGEVHTGAKAEMHAAPRATDAPLARPTAHAHSRSHAHSHAHTRAAEPLVVLHNVSVAYGERKVLDRITWTIRPGERWHLRGANGSGKTTLLALLTGDHPQSYAQRGPSARLTLLGRARAAWPTPLLRARLGVVSPELANAYPRAHAVRDVVAAGFEGGFCPGALGGVVGGEGMGEGEETEMRNGREARVRAVIDALGPRAWGGDGNVDVDRFCGRPFGELSPGEQSMVLLMRALVGRPPLVLLDEAWAGMDEGMVRAAQRYLRDEMGQDQAVVVVSHWEEEVPWTRQEGLSTFRLQDGVGTVV